jgi:hypothetical protein
MIIGTLRHLVTKLLKGFVPTKQTQPLAQAPLEGTSKPSRAKG